MTPAILALSLGVHLGLVSASPFYWFPPALFGFPPQVWRLVTPFLVTGPMLGIPFDTYWLYRYLTQLETGHAKFPNTSDLVWYLMFVGGIIQVRGGVLMTVAVHVSEDRHPCDATPLFLPSPPCALSLFHEFARLASREISFASGRRPSRLVSVIWDEYG